MDNAANPSYPNAAPQQGSNGLATAGLICGVIGFAIVLTWFISPALMLLSFVVWICAILGIIFGAIGMAKSGKVGGKGKKAAVGGLVLGILALVAAFVVPAMILSKAAGDLENLGKGLQNGTIKLDDLPSETK